MLYVTYIPNPAQPRNTRDVCAHVGNTLAVDVHTVVSVQADGHELERIRQRCKNLPDMPGMNVVNWFGDHAKFIVAHW